MNCLKGTLVLPEEHPNSFDSSLKILESYQHWVGYNRGALEIQSADTRTAKKKVQRTIHATALMFCQEHKWDISPETDSGRGPVDFKISRGTDKTVIEVKLTSNQQCVHGITTQIEEYAKSENTDNKIFIVVDTEKDSYRVQSVCDAYEKMKAEGKTPAHLIVIDTVPKKSASQY